MDIITNAQNICEEEEEEDSSAAPDGDGGASPSGPTVGHLSGRRLPRNIAGREEDESQAGTSGGGAVCGPRNPRRTAEIESVVLGRGDAWATRRLRPLPPLVAYNLAVNGRRSRDLLPFWWFVASTSPAFTQEKPLITPRRMTSRIFWDHGEG